MEGIKITVDTEIVGDPKIPIFKIAILDKEKNGIWEETYGSRELAEAFLKGMRAAFSFTEVGFVEIPIVPSR